MFQDRLLRPFLVTFTAVNVLLCYGCSVLFLRSLPLPITPISTVYTVLLYLGHIALYAGLLILVLPLLVLWLFPHRFPRSRTALFFLLALAGACAANIFLIADAEVFATFHWHINAFIWQMVFSGHLGEMADLSSQEWIGFGILISLWVVVELLLAAILWSLWIVRSQRSHATGAILLLTATFICWLFALCIHLWAASVAYQPVLNAANVFPYTWKPNANTWLKKVGLLSARDDVQSLGQLPFMLQGGHFNYPLHPLTIHPPAKKRNVLFLFIDTLRYDMIEEAITPHITQFSQQSSVFTDHYSGGDCTQPGVFSLFYGLPPNYWNVALTDGRGALLMSTLQEQGYRLGIYNSAPLNTPNFAATLFPQIKPLQITTPGDTPWQRDQKITEQLIDFINTDDKRPFFGYVFYDAVHAYSTPDNFPMKFKPWLRHINRMTMLTPEFDPTAYKNRYKDTVVFVDALMGKIFTVLKQRDLLKNTVVVITSDHGEEFNEYHNNYWGHGSGYSNYQIKTPFIVYWPDKAPSHIDYLTTHYDLVPTIMQEVLGVQNPMSDYSIGYSLYNPIKRPFLINGSYGHTALVLDSQIINYFPTSGFQLTDRAMNPTPDQLVNRKMTDEAVKTLYRFYRP